MRLREPFTIFPRTLETGTTVYYYQTYDENNRRTHARSTGQTTKTRARLWCQDQLRAGTLIPAKAENLIPTLAEFGASIWNFDHSDFIKYRRQRGHNFSRSHVDNQLRSFTNRIVPGLGKYRLNELTTPIIEHWFLRFKDEGLSHQTCNHMLFNLRTILGEAVRLGKLPVNPAAGVKPLAKDAKVRGILTQEEVKALLNPNGWSKLWPNWFVYLANLTAASTGLRMGELVALRWVDLYPAERPDRIVVKHSYDRKYGLKSTKTAKDRVIPLTPFLRGMLHRFMPQRGTDAFIFPGSEDGSAMCDRTLTRAFYDALAMIGIDETARKARNITFHGWRHFFNTFLRRSGIQDAKVQMVTGHATTEMTDHYTHFDIGDLKEVEEAQKGLLDNLRGDPSERWLKTED